jgi:Secretion system C-terminal sorting domain
MKVLPKQFTRTVLFLFCCLLFSNLSYSKEEIPGTIDFESTFRSADWPYPRLFNPFDGSNPPLPTSSGDILDEIRDRFNGWGSFYNWKDKIGTDSTSNGTDISTFYNTTTNTYNHEPYHPKDKDCPSDGKYHPWTYLARIYNYAVYLTLNPSDISDWEPLANALKHILLTGYNDVDTQFILLEFPDGLVWEEKALAGAINTYLSNSADANSGNANLNDQPYANIFHKLGTYRGRDFLQALKAYDLLLASGYLDNLSTPTDLKDEIDLNIQRIATELYFSYRIFTGQIQNDFENITIDNFTDMHSSFSNGANYVPSALVFAAIILNDQEPYSEKEYCSLIHEYSKPVNWIQQGLGDLRMSYNASDGSNGIAPDCHFATPVGKAGYESLFQSGGSIGAGADYHMSWFGHSIMAYRSVSTFLNYTGYSSNDFEIKFQTMYSVSNNSKKEFTVKLDEVTGMYKDFNPTPWMEDILTYFTRTIQPSGQNSSFEDSHHKSLFPYGILFNSLSKYNCFILEPYNNIYSNYDNTPKRRWRYLNTFLTGKLMRFDIAAMFQPINGNSKSIYNIVSDDTQDDYILEANEILNLAYPTTQSVKRSPTHKEYAVFRSSWNPNNSMFVYLTGDHGHVNEWDSWDYSAANGEENTYLGIAGYHEQDDNMSFTVMKNGLPIYIDSGYPGWSADNDFSWANHTNSIEWMRLPGNSDPSTLEDPEPEASSTGIAPLPRTDVNIIEAERDYRNQHTGVIQATGSYYDGDGHQTSTGLGDAELERTIILMGFHGLLSGETVSETNLMINWDAIEVSNLSNHDWFRFNLIMNHSTQFDDTSRIYPPGYPNFETDPQGDPTGGPLNGRYSYLKNTETPPNIPFISGGAVEVTGNHFTNPDLTFDENGTEKIKKVKFKFVVRPNTYNTSTFDYRDAKFSTMEWDGEKSHSKTLQAARYSMSIRRPVSSGYNELHFVAVHGFEDWNDTGTDEWEKTGVILKDGWADSSTGTVHKGTWVSFQSSKNKNSDLSWFAGRTVFNRNIYSSNLNDTTIIQIEDEPIGAQTIEVDRYMYVYSQVEPDPIPYRDQEIVRKLATNLKGVVAYHYIYNNNEYVRFVMKEHDPKNMTPFPSSILYYDLDGSGFFTSNENITLSDIDQDDEINILDVFIGQVIPKSIGDNGDLPDHFELSDGYPNPFNAQINIPYQLPEAADVKIEVFNVLGQKVMNVVNEHVQAGYHNVIWNASSANGAMLPSGVYFIKMQASDYLNTKKIVLMK